jgi:hypothetical protein
VWALRALCFYPGGGLCINKIKISVSSVVLRMRGGLDKRGDFY